MAQELPQYCPRCGAATVATQRFCARCGLDMAGMRPYDDDATLGDYSYEGQAPPVVAQPVQPTPVLAQGYQPPTPPQQLMEKPKVGRIALMLILLFLLVFIGGGVFLSARMLGIHLPGVGNDTQPAITTTALNTTATYAGAQITIVDAQQSERFLDDPTTSTPSIVRLHLRAQNSTQVPISFLYGTIAHLVGPGGMVLSPAYIKANTIVAPGTTQAGIVDFAVPSTLKIDQLLLRLGAASEAQLDIPLTAHADLNKYAPKTTQVNGQLQYLGLDWTLANATTQLSIDGQQALKGMQYVIMTLKVNNTLSQQAITGSPYDYARLKTADKTVLPVDSTLPVSFDAGANGKTGTVTFLVPQDATTLTFVLLPQNQSGFTQATTAFKL